MISDTEFAAMLEQINPVADPQSAPDTGEAMWASLARKRTPASPPSRLRSRRRILAVAVAVVGLAAVPAIAFLMEGPPLDRGFAAPESSTVTVFGPADGIPDGCARRVAFTPDGTPVVGGDCGILEQAAGRWSPIAGADSVGTSLTDLAFDLDGGIWVGSPDQPLRRLVGGTVLEMGIISPWVGVGLDGTVWATNFPDGAEAGPPTLVAYTAGSWSAIGGASVDDGASTGVGNFSIGTDGTVWTLVGDEVARVTGTSLESVNVDLPDPGLPMFLTAAPDGSLWIAVESDEVVERLGVSDKVVYLVRYDGATSTSLEVPFAEISDATIASDGTVWASSTLHGVFSYDGDEWTRYGVADGLPTDQVDVIESAPDGAILAGTPAGLVQISPGR